MRVGSVVQQNAIQRINQPISWKSNHNWQSSKCVSLFLPLCLSLGIEADYKHFKALTSFAF